MDETNDLGEPIEFATMTGLGLAIGSLGAFLASRRRENAIGWWFLATGLMFVGNAFSTLYAIHFLNEDPGALPGGMAAALMTQVLGGPIVFMGFIFLFLLFPTGHYLSPRWRWVGIVAVAALTASSLGGLVETELRMAPVDRNPIGSARIQELRETPELVAGFLMLFAVAASLTSIVVRFRRSRGEERQQMRWITWAAGLLGIVLLLAPIFWSTPSLEPLWGFLWIAGVAAIPISSAIAILKYRLYEIDVIVNRTLVYLSLTAILGLMYLGGVVVLQSLLGPVTAESDLAVAGSTLAVAAVFRPARARVQTFIDHRFYRRKYDAAATLEAFSSRIRDQIDLTSMGRELVSIVGTTMHPAHVSLWLRPPEKAGIR
ncbi:MAG: hypothetical protein ACLGIB_09120 [Actinomycetota bacterium]